MATKDNLSLVVLVVLSCLFLIGLIDAFKGEQNGAEWRSMYERLFEPENYQKLNTELDQLNTSKIIENLNHLKEIIPSEEQQVKQNVVNILDLIETTECNDDLFVKINSALSWCRESKIAKYLLYEYFKRCLGEHSKNLQTIVSLLDTKFNDKMINLRQSISKFDKIGKDTEKRTYHGHLPSDQLAMGALDYMESKIPFGKLRADLSKFDASKLNEEPKEGEFVYVYKKLISPICEIINEKFQKSLIFFDELIRDQSIGVNLDLDNHTITWVTNAGICRDLLNQPIVLKEAWKAYKHKYQKKEGGFRWFNEFLLTIPFPFQ